MEYKHYVIFAFTRWQILVSLLLLLWLTSCSAQSTYYVTPTPDTPCPGEPCHILSQYVADQDFNNLSVNTTMEFLPGNHTLETTISVTNLTWLTLHGDSSSLPEITSRIVCTWPAGLVFTDITELHISSLAFISCGHNDSAAVNIISVEQSNISNSSFHSNVNADSYANGFRSGHNGGALYVHNSSVSLTVNKFQYNSAGNGGALYMDTSNSIITGNTFEYNYAEYGGTLYVQSSSLCLIRSTLHNNFAKLNGGVLCAKSSTLDLTWSIFQNNSAGWSGGAVFADSCNLNLTRNTFHNNLADDQRGGALYAGSSTHNLTRNTFQKNIDSTYGGALYVNSSTLTLTRNTFHSNSVKYWYERYEGMSQGGALYVHSSTLNFTRNTFHSNTAWEVGGALYVHSSTLNFTRNTFHSNTAWDEGGALYVHLSTLNFTRNIFHSNTATSFWQGGGALYVFSSTLYLTTNTFHNNTANENGGVFYVFSSTLNLTTNAFHNNTATWSGGGVFYVKSSTLNLTTNTFHNNRADGSGGVFYVESSTLNLTRCTFQNNLANRSGGVLYVQSGTLNLTNSIFQSNSAIVWGGALYVLFSTLSFTGCTFQHNTAECGGAMYVLTSTFNQLTRNTFQSNSADYGGALDIFSDQLRLCTCRNNLTDCTRTYSSEPVYPGGTMEVPVIAYGQWNGTTAAVLAVTNTPNGDITVNNHENTPNVIYYNSCSPLKYTIHSRAIGTTHEITLYIAKSPCSPTDAKTLIVFVGILSCPPGFQLSQTQSKCICDKRLRQFTKTCLIDYTTVLRSQDAGFWVGYDKKSQGLILHPHCPFDYCVSKEMYLVVDDSDKQCNYNRSGLLCGRCGDNLSLALGSSRCLQCSNSYLSLLAAFAFAGITLVVLLLVLRLTVAAGTINGLIFYANVVAVNSAIFFQPQTTNILTVFIAWLNLDLGIETCFYNGMEAYVKTWLQFAFPLYVWALVGMIILGSYYSGRISRLFGSNPIAVLATLFLLSYAKLLRTVFVTLSYTHLKYPNNSQIAVWLYDGNIKYLTGKHIPLFIAAMVCLLFLFLPYTMLLILGQWLQAKSQLKILSCISRPKIMPFLDAYHAPYTDKHRYWTGLMLLLRFVLFLIFAVNALGDPSVNILAIAFTTVAILTFTKLNSRIYKTWSLGLLETSFILNLNILAVATLYIRLTGGNQNAATFTSVGIAFATFTGIVIYHSIQQIKGTRLWRRLSLRLNSMANNINSGPEDRPGSPLNLVFMSGSAPTQTVVCIRNSELREPLLTSE